MIGGKAQMPVSWLACLAVVLVAACVVKNPSYCDETTPCPASQQCVLELHACMPRGSNTDAAGSSDSDGGSSSAILDAAEQPAQDAMGVEAADGAQDAEDAIAFEVIAVDPADGAQNRATDSVLSITFSEPVDPLSIDESTVIMRLDYGEPAPAEDRFIVPGTFEVSGSTVTFRPTLHLATLEQYVVDVTDDVLDLSGHRLAAPFSSRFGTADGRWSAEEEPTVLNGGRPAEVDGPLVLETDSWGNAFALWVEGNRVYARRYDRAAGGWDTPLPGQLPGTQLGTVAGRVYTIDLAFDEKGNAWVVWDQRETDGAFRAYTAHYRLGGGWTPAERLGRDEDGDELGPRVAAGPEGSALAVWQQHGVRARYHDPDTGWQTDGSGDPDSKLLAPGGIAPYVAMTRAGRGLVVWIEPGDDHYRAWRFSDSGQHWDQIIRRKPDGYLTAPSPGIRDLALGAAQTSASYRAVVNEGGDAVVVYWLWGSGGVQLWSNAISTADAGSSLLLAYDEPVPVLGSAVRIDTAADAHANYPHMAFDDAGDGTVVWRQGAFAAESHQIYARRYDHAAGSWEPSVVPLGSLAGGVQAPRVTVDRRGRALAVWAQQDGIWGARYTPAEGWSVAKTQRIRAGETPWRATVDGAIGVAVDPWRGVGLAAWIDDRVYPVSASFE